MDNETQVKEEQFVEEVGIFFKRNGLPRMAGRIFGWLMISGTSYQSVGEITEALTVSKGSVSAMTRHLIQIGLIERLSRLGVRHDYFQIRTDAWHYFIKQNLQRLTVLRKLAEHGLELMEGKAPLTQQRLEEMRNMCAFFERESLAVLEGWGRRRNYDLH